MKSYWMVAAALLLAAHSGANPRVWAAQSATPTNTAQEDPKHAAATDQSQAAAKAATPNTPASSSAGEPAFYILAEFTQSLNAKKLKPGDQVKAQVTQDVLAHGKVIIPVESKLVGHVTEVKAHQKNDPGSRLGMVFDKVLLRHRLEVDFRGVLHALSAPATWRSMVDEPDPMPSPNPMGINRPPGPMLGSGVPPSPSINPAGSPPPFSNGPPPTPVPNMRGSTAGGIPNKMPRSPVLSRGQSPMSLGMPLGVFGLQGLSLTPGPSVSTPGPVILSHANDVKLESGTQILLKITGAAVRKP